jgi:hypothetical protein
MLGKTAEGLIMKTTLFALGAVFIFSAPARAAEPCAAKAPCRAPAEKCTGEKCAKEAQPYLSKEAAQALTDLFKVALSANGVEASSLFH